VFESHQFRIDNLVREKKRLLQSARPNRATPSAHSAFPHVQHATPPDDRAALESDSSCTAQELALESTVCAGVSIVNVDNVDEPYDHEGDQWDSEEPTVQVD
jgi:hypothetical protein